MKYLSIKLTDAMYKKVIDYELDPSVPVQIVESIRHGKENRWIPMTTRPMAEEEREYYREWSGVEEAMIFDCPLPDDGQEVLVSWGGMVGVDVFVNDCDGCYFEGVDIDYVQAWMPLPEPYKPESEE